MAALMRSLTVDATTGQPNLVRSKIFDSKDEPLPIHVYPFGTNVYCLSQKYRTVKTLYMIRHAQATHNVKKDYRASHNLDARLTEEGKAQCQALAQRLGSAQDPIAAQIMAQSAAANLAIISSPLTRCLQTSLWSLEPILKAQPNARILAHEGIRETVNYNCDRRRSIDELIQEFGRTLFRDGLVDFSHVQPNHDALWEHYETRLGCPETFCGHRESAEIYRVAHRAKSFWHDFVAPRVDASHIIMVSHCAFLRAQWNFGHGVATTVPQSLDDRNNHNDDDDPKDVAREQDVPVFQFMGGDGNNDASAETGFAKSLRADFDNCELRAMVLAFQ